MTPSPQVGGPMVDQVARLAAVLRKAGIEVATGDLIDAGRALMLLDLLDRELVRGALRSVMISREPDLAVFDRAFDLVFAPGGLDAEQQAVAPGLGASADQPTAASLAADVGGAAASGDTEAMRALAARAVSMYGGDGASDRQVIHRIMRAIDLANMLSAVMRRLRRDGELSEFELSLRRHEVARALEEFRRALADEIAKSRLAGDGDGDDRELPVGALDRPVLSLSSAELAELRRTLQPLARQLAARVGRRRKPRTTGRLDPRRTFRRSLQTGGIPIDPALRRRHPHRPDVVVLCDISGSVAEFAQFTFTLVHAIHDVLAGVRSYAFVGGIADMTEIFTSADFDVPVQHVLERGGVVGFDGHSDYGAVFQQFCDRYLDDVVGRRTTVLVTGDGRTNFRDAGVAAFARIAERARRVYWLDPEPEGEWETDDSAMAAYRPLCDGVFEVSTIRALSDVIAALV
ncbi:MAG: vWA domain-containing protein [Ilumatobacteraceae bacterium]